MRRTSARYLVGCAVLMAATGVLARDKALETAPYMDAKLSVEERMADLLSRMTLTEKELGFWNRQVEYVVEPGDFTIAVSDSFDAPAFADPVNTATYTYRK